MQRTILKAGLKTGAALKRPRPHSPTSHYATLPCSKLHTPRHHTALHYFAWHCTARHYIARHHITQHRDAWRRATWFCIARHYSSWHYSAWRYIAWDHATRHFLDDIILSCIVGRKNYVIFVPAELRSIREQPKQFHYFLPLHPFVCTPFCFIFSFCVRSVPFHLLLCFIEPTAYVCAQFHFAYFSVLFHLLHLHGRCFMPLFY